MARAYQSDLVLGHISWLQDISLEYGAFARPVAEDWVVSGAVVYLGGGVIPQPERFEITGVAYEASPQKVTLTWPSKDGHLYLIEASTDGKDWSEWELNDSFLSQGDETRFEHAPQAEAELPSTLIYRVTDLGLAP